MVVATALLGMAAMILSGLNERRREMAILRALGARPRHVFALLVSESALLALAGAVIGTGLTYGALTLGAPTLEQRYGVHLGDTLPGLYDFALIGVVTGASAVLGFIPAWAAFRNSLADGMTIRT